MNLSTSKTILKVFGYITIVLSILGIIGGVMAIAGGSIVGIGATSGELGSDVKDAATAIALLGFGGLVILLTSIVDLIKGVFSVKAAKDISKIMPAWIFALIGVILSVIGAVVTFMNPTNGQTTSNIIGIIIGIAIDVLIFVAADNIKKAAGK